MAFGDKRKIKKTDPSLGRLYRQAIRLGWFFEENHRGDDCSFGATTHERGTRRQSQIIRTFAMVDGERLSELVGYGQLYDMVYPERRMARGRKILKELEGYGARYEVTPDATSHVLTFKAHWPTIDIRADLEGFYVIDRAVDLWRKSAYYRQLVAEVIVERGITPDDVTGLGIEF
ncbi:hypothetical protein [Fimbriiglobus ruber]|uniref:Uncharacterized protein n=1 Tax=Fimbriiglobus ruber TaxID=1908690 RepID=A0A225D8T1_9BACT|nr:hypothetical protein [Fimbriiglobus ruber]OWK34948.1 hypothetical protein FRUB_09790 [Fimbriiglobus ruber]